MVEVTIYFLNQEFLSFIQYNLLDRMLGQNSYKSLTQSCETGLFRLEGFTRLRIGISHLYIP